MKQRFAVYVVKLIAQHVLMQNRWSDTRLFADSTPANFLEQASRARKRKEEGREEKWVLFGAFFMFSNFYHLDLHRNKNHVALANL